MSLQLVTPYELEILRTLRASMGLSMPRMSPGSDSGHSSPGSGYMYHQDEPVEMPPPGLDLHGVIRHNYTSGNGGLAEELERLFISEPRARLGSAGNDSVGSIEEFRSNGIDKEMDYFDRLQAIGVQKTRPRPTRAEELLAKKEHCLLRPCDPREPTMTRQDLITKESVLQLLSRRAQHTKRPSPSSSAAARKRAVCVFCKNNGESEEIYACHTLKDANGRVTCPVLRAYTCPHCNANGDNAHTVKYCPVASSEPIIDIKMLRTPRNASGRRRIL